MPSSVSLGVLELLSPNILTYLMNVSCMDDMKKVYNPLYLVVYYAPTPTSPMHGVTSHVQVKDPVCIVVHCCVEARLADLIPCTLIWENAISLLPN